MVEILGLMLFWALWATLFPIVLGLRVSFAILDELMKTLLVTANAVHDIATKA
jgi:hypothetical protein